jgi:transcriptional regulator with XRE-family HTH domain
VATPKAIQRNFGRVLRDFREDAGLSQERLAHDSGLHKNYVGEIERGLKSPSLKSITALASTLKVLPSELLREAEERAG